LRNGRSKFDWLKKVKGDYFQYRSLFPSARNIIVFFLLNSGFRAVVLFRFQEHFTKKKKIRAAIILSNINQAWTGAEFTPGCKIGKGLVVRHPSGIVIGGSVVVGENLTIHQGVTIGEKFRTTSSFSESPVLGDNINIGANSVIAGGIELGNNLTIGALTYVNMNFLEPGTIVGIPARYK
jgi:serine O-acetyltransferase